MKFQRAIAATSIAILLAGCAGANIGMRTGNTPPPGGSALPPGNAYSYSSVNVQADVSPGAYFGLAFLGYMLIGIQDNFRSWGYGVYSPRPPALAEDRAVAERDCSQPLEPLSANLRCK
jgi:hypothetical protein